jgi:hypothetical protein
MRQWLILRLLLATGPVAVTVEMRIGGCDEADSVATTIGYIQVSVRINDNDGWKR